MENSESRPITENFMIALLLYTASCIHTLDVFLSLQNHFKLSIGREANCMLLRTTMLINSECS
jgi:hypothetical protein